MVGGVFFEHGHRMIATAVGFLILVAAFWTQFDETRPGVRRLAWWTLFVVCLQGVLGGVTVWFGLPVAVSAPRGRARPRGAEGLRRARPLAVEGGLPRP